MMRGQQPNDPEDSSMRTSTGAAVLLLASALLLLSGCTTTGSYAVLDRPAEPGDKIPADVLAIDVDFELDSSRFVGEDQATRFWLAAPSVDGAEICLVAYPTDGDDWFAGCGTGLTITGYGLGSYTVQPDGMPTPDNATRVSENVFRVGT